MSIGRGLDDFTDHEDARAEKLLGIVKFLRSQIACYDAYLRVAANEESRDHLATAIEGLVDTASVAQERFERDCL